MIWLLLSISDWSIMMIGPGGLLLVVPHLFAVPVLVLWVGLPNKKYTTKTWMWKNIVVQDHILSTFGDALGQYQLQKDSYMTWCNINPISVFARVVSNLGATFWGQFWFFGRSWIWLSIRLWGIWTIGSKFWEKFRTRNRSGNWQKIGTSPKINDRPFVRIKIRTSPKAWFIPGFGILRFQLLIFLKVFLLDMLLIWEK